MFIKQIQLNYFRCFIQKKIAIDHQIVLIEGLNGTGKTSLLEALHYACYLRSFRTHSPRELVSFNQNTFSIKLRFSYKETMNDDHTLHIGYAGNKRLVKFNDASLKSYKELMNYFRVITLTEDDLGLIQLGPDVRRYFIDQAIILYKPDYMELLKEYKTIVDNRNRFLQKSKYMDMCQYKIWTEQLWHTSRLIQDQRTEFIALLHEEVNHIIHTYFPALEVIFSYKPKRHMNQLEDIVYSEKFFEQERLFGRSLFGAHLDDLAIQFQGTSSRNFASRGQQKLILLLIKVAQLKMLHKKKGDALFLLDDFMTDFDQARASIVLDVLGALQTQLIFTAPLKTSVLGEMLHKQGAQLIDISA